jgi:Ni,Fe-hydrogenase I cytochrome b subunit
MGGLRVWVVLAWIALPTVMYGGYSLLRLINRGDPLTPFQVGWFRAGHAHAGVLLLMSLLYYVFLDNTSLNLAVKHAACVVLFLASLPSQEDFSCT